MNALDELQSRVARAYSQMLAAPKDQQRAWQAVFLAAYLDAVRRRNEQRDVRVVERERGLA